MAARVERPLEEALHASLTYQGCLDVAVYALLVARELGRDHSPDGDIVNAWAGAARELVGSVGQPFDRAFLKRRLRELI